MDPVTEGTLWFFGALLAGGLAGWAVGSFTRFETGLGIGLLVPGAVAMSYAARMWLAWRGAAPGPEANELRGGAIAFLLFGSFPLSAGAFFAAKPFLREPPAAAGPDAPGAWDARRVAIVALNLAILAGIAWTAVAPGPIERGLMQGFGVVGAAILLHGVRGLFDPRASAAWCLGMLVVGANFAVWVVALHMLIGQS